MRDRDLLAVCIADEAGNQGQAGKVAVGRVVMNRLMRRYASDGTIAGTILAPGQFSGFWFEMVNGVYKRVATTRAQAEARSVAKLAAYSARPAFWAGCLGAADMATGASDFVAPLLGSASERMAMGWIAIRSEAVLYYNPAVIKTPPAWADPAKRLGAIQDHTFYGD